VENQEISKQGGNKEPKRQETKIAGRGEGKEGKKKISEVGVSLKSKKGEKLKKQQQGNSEKEIGVTTNERKRVTTGRAPCHLLGRKGATGLKGITKKNSRERTIDDKMDNSQSTGLDAGGGVFAPQLRVLGLKQKKGKSYHWGRGCGR